MPVVARRRPEEAAEHLTCALLLDAAAVDFARHGDARLRALHAELCADRPPAVARELLLLFRDRAYFSRA